MISGKYLGEIVRQALLALVKNGTLFGGKTSEKFDKFEAFESRFVSMIEAGYVIIVQSSMYNGWYNSLHCLLSHGRLCKCQVLARHQYSTCLIYVSCSFIVMWHVITVISLWYPYHVHIVELLRIVKRSSKKISLLRPLMRTVTM